MICKCLIYRFVDGKVICTSSSFACTWLIGDSLQLQTKISCFVTVDVEKTLSIIFCVT